jgi:hypothetical protein
MRRPVRCGRCQRRGEVCSPGRSTAWCTWPRRCPRTSSRNV